MFMSHAKHTILHDLIAGSNNMCDLTGIFDTQMCDFYGALSCYGARMVSIMIVVTI